MALLPVDMSVNCAVEPRNLDGSLFIARMPERAHFVPLGGISTVPFRHDDLLNLEPVKCIVVMFRSQHLFSSSLGTG